MNASIIGLVNQKGGTGKTTTCVNLGIDLAREGKKVLIADCDPQGSATISLGHPQPDALPVTLTDLMGKVLNDVVGGKWCEPGLNIPIKSDDIVMNEYYSVTARGNTLHYDNDGVERVELRVNMYVNMNANPKEKAPITDDDLDHAIFD